jgi:hypothetical protein
MDGNKPQARAAVHPVDSSHGLIDGSVFGLIRGIGELGVWDIAQRFPGVANLPVEGGFG